MLASYFAPITNTEYSRASWSTFETLSVRTAWKRSLKTTVQLHADKVEQEVELVSDTTVREANVKFLTVTHLHMDRIERLWRIAEAEAASWQPQLCAHRACVFDTLATP